ncbi:MAG: response regulator [Candidatus Magnetomorum sp.]|nr:response regulator [Candidatus Magnetomorum sp.]
MKEKQINILLVDDDPKFLASLAERAKLKGFNVLTAENGTSALEIAQKNTIHVAVVDQQMPDIEGLVVITKLTTLSPDIRTILLTGQGDDKLKEATQALNSKYFDKGEMGNFWNFLSNLPLGNLNILLVDDNQNFINTLAARIRLKGYDPLIALNGREALEIARSNKIHMAVVDQQMPDMDGLVVITKLKEIDPEIKTLLLTGHGDEKLKEATQALNSQYFEKEDMNTFWGFIRKSLQSIEKHMAAVGMATGGDLDDAIKIESSGK